MKNEMNTFDASVTDVENWFDESGIFEMIAEKSEETYEKYGSDSMCPVFTTFHHMVNVLLDQGWTVEDLNNHIKEHVEAMESK